MEIDEHQTANRGRGTGRLRDRAGPRRRGGGEHSHRAILRTAARLASVEGLLGLSIATLAKHVGLSKSGLFAHFRSKEDLQLETIEVAGEIFDEDVVRPALAAPPGVARLRSLADRFLSHVERKVFPGGCFFAAAAAEMDGHPGPVRDRIAAFQRSWMELQVRMVCEAQSVGEIRPDEDPAQVSFEFNGMLVGANSSFLLQGDPAVLSRARVGVERVLAAALARKGSRANPRRGSRPRGGG